MREPVFGLEGIDAVWGLHADRDERFAGEGRCLAFVIGRRYIAADFDPNESLRVGVSFGNNPFTPEMATGFVPPPVVPGPFVFGIHLIGTIGKELRLYDQWFQAREAGDCRTAAEGRERAQAILESMSDQDYLCVIGNKDSSVESLKRSAASEVFGLDEYEMLHDSEPSRTDGP